MPATYEPISTQTLGADTASISFTSIPSTYTDLVLVAVGSTTSATQNMRIQFNGDTSTNYSRTRILAGFSSPSTERQSNANSMGVGDWGTGSGVVVINIQNYANTSINKTVLSRSNEPEYESAYIGLWRSTAAINSVSFFKNRSSLTAGSVFTLYGIKVA